jgi:hypothetical protein
LAFPWAPRERLFAPLDFLFDDDFERVEPELDLAERPADFDRHTHGWAVNAQNGTASSHLNNVWRPSLAVLARRIDEDEELPLH